jgi:phosphate-selective porin OprO and OprP
LRRLFSTSILSATLALSLTAAAQEQAPANPPAEQPAQPAEAPAAAPAPAVPADLESRLQDIDQRARIAERKLEILEEAAAAAKTTTPVVAAGERGFNWSSADKAFVVKVRGYTHVDAREYFEDKDLKNRDTFLIRRARPVLEATFFDVADFRLMPDFGGGQTVLFDAYIDLRPFPWLKLRAGKFKPPVGLERLQSATAILFPERALPTALVPNRDVGFQLHGVLGPSVATYELGVFNGVVDGGNADVDTNHAKDFAGRLFLTPFKFDPYNLLANLGVGVSGTWGNQRGTPAVWDTTGATPRRTASSVPGLPSYRSAGQQTFFSYLVNDDAVDATVIGKGKRTRLSPQGYYYYGGLGLLGEYVVSSTKVVKGANNATLTHKAWQAAASYVFGGKNAFEGVTVTAPFEPSKGTWGALELAARYNALLLDEDSFPTYANLARSAEKARAWGAAATWHWSRNIKLVVSFEQTHFEGGAAANGDRKTENVLFQRVQAAF